MEGQVQQWSATVKIPSTTLYSVAIVATIFRLLYRWRTTRLWWEDAWAAMALICGIACLVSVWMQNSPHNDNESPNLNGNWLLSLSITATVWMARMSILYSIIRIVNPSSKLRRIAYCVGIMFMAMQAGLIAQKIDICITNSCKMTNPVAIAQLVTDVISDTILVALPIWSLRGVKLPRGCRILILAAFSASILITVVTILHSILLIQEPTSVTVIIGHMKAALALFVCNSLVLVILVHRLWQRPGVGTEYATTGAGVCTSLIELTSVVDPPVYPVLDRHGVPSNEPVEATDGRLEI